ncbi:hypothetical protein RM549_16955 [Salegentibacter sp. F188]|uniref:Uncharacterized protein n=1 Tax=Autumnicola patrickiae TaxID=3075591 RepID=A0ABU3E6A7_9FLAO|nr:hypothetical protein [Salegentibacter sp. F188]MDT0691485.1 hypothetical protein [Salegentibacter sp. F188]
MTFNSSEAFSQKKTALLLKTLILLDLVFVANHLLNFYTHYLSNPLFSLKEDMGYAEIYGYFKWLGIVILLISLSKNLDNRRYLSWGLLFAYLLCDDAFSIHEKLGYHISTFLEITFLGLNQQDSGELVFFAVIGTIITGWLLYNYIMGGKIFRKFSIHLFLLFAVLIFFGVCVDITGTLLRPYPGIYPLVGIIEDGGELVTASFILVYIFSWLPSNYLLVPM